MEWADLAILAGGTTSWEAAFMSLPAVYTPGADNQRPIARALAAAGAGLCAEDAPALAAAVAALRTDASGRARISAAAGALVDGRGTSRVIDKMKSLSESA
jgi:spore coat polysaccharide biosynthesis predicted glycosyltransferase SpsG